MIVAGILTPLEDLLTWVLTNLHETVGLTWAWSIVALTVIVRVLLVPVAIRQIERVAQQSNTAIFETDRPTQKSAAGR